MEEPKTKIQEKVEDIKDNISDVKEDTKDLLDHATDYLETLYQLTLVNISQKAINIGSALINSIIIAFLGLFTVMFGGLALSWWLGDILKSRSAGFLIVSAFFLVLIVLIIAMRKKNILPFLRNMITRKIYD